MWQSWILLRTMASSLVMNSQEIKGECVTAHALSIDWPQSSEKRQKKSLSCSPEATVTTVWKTAVCKRGVSKRGILKCPVFPCSELQRLDLTHLWQNYINLLCWKWVYSNLEVQNIETGCFKMPCLQTPCLQMAVFQTGITVASRLWL